jgi:hypothetical protein
MPPLLAWVMDVVLAPPCCEIEAEVEMAWDSTPEALEPVATETDCDWASALPLWLTALPSLQLWTPPTNWRVPVAQDGAEPIPTATELEVAWPPLTPVALAVESATAPDWEIALEMAVASPPLTALATAPA